MRLFGRTFGAEPPSEPQPEYAEYADEYVGADQMEIVEGGRELGREYAPLPVPVPASGAAGSDLDSWYLDVIAGGPDVNPILHGRAKFDVYDEMRMSDATVRSVLWMFKLPIRGATWTVDAASDDPADELIADALSWNLGLQDHENQGRLDLTWTDSLEQACLFLDWGCMFEEKIWGDPELWTDGDGDEHVIRPLARMAPRMPRTVLRAPIDPASGALVEVVQDVPGTRPIPGDKILHYALEREGRNWWGVSLLRAMYGGWRLKKALMIASGIGWDRFAVGVPIVRYPLGGGENARRQAMQIGREYRNNERAYVVLEGPPPTGSAPALWDIEIKNGATSLADPTNLLRMFDEQITTAGLQQFSRLGMTQHGSRAVGDTLAESAYLAVQTVAKHIAATRMKHMVRQWVDVNFGPDVDSPKLSVSKIQTRNIPTLAQAIYDLSQAGMTFTDVDTQNNIRDQLDLDHLPDALVATLEGLPPDVGVMPTEPAASTVPAPTAEPGVGQTESQPLDPTGAP